MKLNKLGISDLRVSQISLGTMTFGEQTNKKETFKILDYAFDNGINFFDTAEMYPVYPKKLTQGRSEKYLGEWMSKKKLRSNVVISTKVSSSNKDGTGASNLSWLRGGKKNLNFQKKNLNKAVNLSLKRLKTDYIDLYHLHFPERIAPMYGKLDFEFNFKEEYWTPILEVLENISCLIKEGKIRYFGISNESPWGMMKFITLAETNNLEKPIVTQNAYNLINRVFDIASSEISIRENLKLLAYSPLAGGRLTGKYLNGKRPKKSRYTMWPGRFSRHLTDRGDNAVAKYFKLSTELGYELKDLANLFVLSRPFVSSSIIGVTSLDQLKSNLKFIDLKLDASTIIKINKIHNLDPNPCV